MKRILPIIMATLILLSACTTEKGIEAHNAWARPAAQGGNGGVYFELHNHEPTTDELIGASSDIAEAVEIHESKMEGDVMQMQMITSLPLDAYAEVEFEPGGLHVMLVNLKQDLKQSDEFEIVLHFKSYEDIIVHVLVNDSAPEEDHGM